MTIDSATEADREWCARLMASTDPWITLGRSYEQCLARCRQPDLVLQVLRISGQPRGFVLMHPTGLAGSPYIATIVIAQESRGQGLGAALLDFADHYFPQARHIFLCVSSFNVAARRLYERRGYSQVGELKDYVIAGASEILMHKRLRAT